MGKIYSLHFDLENVSTFSQKVLKLMWNVCFFLLSPEFSTPRNVLDFEKVTPVVEIMSSILRFMLCSFNRSPSRRTRRQHTPRSWDNKVSDLGTVDCCEQLNLVPGIFVRMLPVLVRALVGDKAWFQFRHCLFSSHELEKVLISHEREYVLVITNSVSEWWDVKVQATFRCWSYAVLRAPFGAFSPLPRCREYHGNSRFYYLVRVSKYQERLL